VRRHIKPYPLAEFAGKALLIIGFIKAFLIMPARPWVYPKPLPVPCFRGKRLTLMLRRRKNVAMHNNIPYMSFIAKGRLMRGFQTKGAHHYGYCQESC
jgi:hypothetical protein